MSIIDSITRKNNNNNNSRNYIDHAFIKSKFSIISGKLFDSIAAKHI